MRATERGAGTVGLAALVLAAVAACDDDVAPASTGGGHAVILLYHHVSEKTPPSTSVTPAVFESHLDYLASNGYNVMPLADIVAVFRNRESMPPDAVAITFDDGYESILTEALPRLSRRGWPFTVFVSTDAIDQGFANFMDWEDLRRIEAEGGSIANHTRTHEHLVRRLPGESGAAWRERTVEDIETAQQRLDDELDNPARLFAYPYGEFDADLERLTASLGYVAFGQQSGPAGFASGLQKLPRFPMAAGFADLDDFAEKLRTRPLPVTVLSPDSGVLPPGAGPPKLRLRVADGPYRLDALRCYVAGQDPAKVDRRGDNVTITAQAPLRPGRSKFNCTAPSSGEDGVYHWFSYVWMQPNDDGSWYEE